MSNRGRYDSAMFWLAFGTAAAVIGLALMTIGVSRSAPATNLLSSKWFDIGLGLLVFGGVLLLSALVLYLMRRSATAQTQGSSGSGAPSPDKDIEAIRGYYGEREKLFKMWGRQEKNRQPKK